MRKQKWYLFLAETILAATNPVDTSREEATTESTRSASIEDQMSQALLEELEVQVVLDVSSYMSRSSAAAAIVSTVAENSSNPESTASDSNSF